MQTPHVFATLLPVSFRTGFIPNSLDCLAKRLLYGQQMCLISIGLAGPKKSFRAILLPTGDHVDMQMRDALAHVVVDPDERSFSHHNLFESARHPFGEAENGFDQGRWQINNRLVVGLWAQSDSGLETAADDQEKLGFAGLHKPRDVDFTLNDLAESAIRVELPGRQFLSFRVGLQHTDVQPSDSGS